MKNLDDFINNKVKISDYIKSDSIFDKNKNEKPNFSVVVPCYNTGATIERTVASVLNQTLNNIEIIVVNDASTDKQTIKKLKELEKYIKVVYLEKNKGVSNARNVGIKKSHGKYCICLDADDFIEETYLKKAKNIFDANNKIGVVSCGVQDFGELNNKWVNSANFGIKDLLAINQVITAACVRREIYREVGGYDTNLSFGEDWEFWIRIFASDKKWKNKVIQENLFYYFVHNDSVQHSVREEVIKKTLSVILNKHKDLYKKYFLDIFSIVYIEYTKNRLNNKKLLHNINLKNKQIQERNKWLAEKNEQIQERNKWLAEKNEQIRKKNEQIQEKNKIIKQKEQIIQQKDQEITQKDVIIRRSNEQIKQLQNSKTFQVGDLFFRSIKKPYKLITFPINLVKILKK